MKDWIVRIAILLLLGIILGVPFLLRPAQEARATSTTIPGNAPLERLVILTPHPEQVRYEIARGFNRYRIAQGKPPIEFDWRATGGTSDLRKQVMAEYQSAADHHANPPGYDLFFGGGDFEHDILARGIVVRQDGKESRQPLTAPIHIPPDLLKKIFPEPTIGGVRLYQPQLRWVGVVLSSFGIIYNRDLLGMLGLPQPRTWSDLCDGRYQQAVALADPAHSGSVAVTYNTILRRMGWTKGWGTLRRIFANARYVTDGATKVVIDVSAGEAAAGMCIDFYGRYQAGAVGGNRIGYVDPAYMTAVTPDPVSILRGARHPELSLKFVLWLLSTQGQRLWQARVGEPGGPERYELRRMPIRRDMYTKAEMAHWADQVNPFDIAKPLPPGMPDFYPAVAPVCHAMAIDIHDDLTAAWAAILDHPDHPRRAQMLALFDAMPPELTLNWPDADLDANWAMILANAKNPRHGEVAGVLKAFVDRLADRYHGWKDADRMLADRLAWTKFFRGNYRKIVEMAAKKFEIRNSKFESNSNDPNSNDSSD